MENFTSRIKELAEQGYKCAEDLPIEYYSELLVLYVEMSNKLYIHKKEHRQIIKGIKSAIDESNKKGKKYFEESIRSFYPFITNMINEWFNKLKE